MLYHVRISVEGESSDETRTDLEYDELDRMVLEPYRTGQPITINGRTISLEDVKRIRISQSEQPAESLFARLKAEDRASSVFVVGGPSYEWRAADRFDDVTDQYITGPPGAAAAPATGRTDTKHSTEEELGQSVGGGRRVFVVSGRDGQARRAVTAVLQALGLTIVEWGHAVAKTGLPNPYVGDVVEAGLRMADAAVVIMTPDDLVRLRPDLLEDRDGEDERKIQGQPRPNVIYEAGFADAIGRERTVLIEIGDVKSFSDATGRHVVRYDGSAAKRNSLADRLALAGLEVDKTGEEWLTVGELAEAVADARDAVEGARLEREAAIEPQTGEAE